MEPRHFWVLLRAHMRTQAETGQGGKPLSPQEVEAIQAEFMGARGRWI
jgi:hypothetical protein